MFFGQTGLFTAQLVSNAITVSLASVGTFVILKVIGFFMESRVSQREEAEGLDISEHGESAYPSFTGMD